MFELGWVEIVLIGVIALVVLGPERLPKAARFVGLWVRKARAQWFAVKSEMERELAVEEMKAAMEREGRSIRNTVDEATEAFNDAKQSLDDTVRETRVELSSSADADADVPQSTTAAPPAALPPANAERTSSTPRND